MNLFRVSALALTLSLAACATHDGVYEPACVAYEGDRVELKDGRYEWQRFTDERKVDESGNVMKPFPGYPKTGEYRVSSGRLELLNDNRSRLHYWFIIESEGERYLLDAEQHNAFADDGKLPKCPLKFAAAE